MLFGRTTNLLFAPTTSLRLRLQVDAAGRWAIWAFPASGYNPGSPIAVGHDSDLPTGGALASGRVDTYDHYVSATALTRTYDNFLAFAPTVDAAIFSGRSLRLIGDAIEREDASGSVWGRVGSYRGSWLRVPVGQSRVAVLTSVHDPLTMPHTTATTTVQATVTPRALAVPR